MVLPKQKTVEDAVAARLRRVCEKKPSGRCHVPPEIHELFGNRVVTNEMSWRKYSSTLVKTRTMVSKNVIDVLK